MTSPVRQTVPLGAQWPTLDPFLFCAHHLDQYPAANGQLGPDASLEGRNIGMDFDGVDGWNMYHGSTVPGFPQHPHRGFETVTYVRSGWCDHSDSLGARARFGQGDVQWLTAGSGIVHSEMFPLFDTFGPNPLHLFQIWLNLPGANKMVSPYYSMLWGADLPIVETDTGARVTAIAGAIGEHTPPAPPPDSWASRADSEVAIWHIELQAGGSWTLPAVADGVNRVLYLFEGDSLTLGSLADPERPDRESPDRQSPDRQSRATLGADTGAVIDGSGQIDLRADGPVECMLLQGRPIGEPVAQHGPFVMNTQAELQQAFADYQRTGFGGWPWPTDDPVHGGTEARFELDQHADA